MNDLKPGDVIEGKFRATVVHIMTNEFGGEPSVMVRFDYQTPGLWLGTIPGLMVEKVSLIEEAKLDRLSEIHLARADAACSER
jgi:hypothetical protein